MKGGKVCQMNKKKKTPSEEGDKEKEVVGYEVAIHSNHLIQGRQYRGLGER